MPTRRGFLKGLLAVTLVGLFSALYGFFIEPVLRLRVRRWQIRRAGWPKPLRIAILSDIHMGEPYVTLERLRGIVARTNALGADLILCLGDLTASHRFLTAPVAVEDTARLLGELKAPLGVYGILGNHDWWDDPEAQARGAGPVRGCLVLEAVGIPILENQALELTQGIWLAGLGDQLALARGQGRFEGVDDLPATLAAVPENAPCILMAHEPDIFPRVPERIGLTLSGHTHGGQVRLFGWSPMVPSRYGNRFAYGHVQEAGRDLVVSGGIGCSIMPVRFGVTPEITVVEISGTET